MESKSVKCWLIAFFCVENNIIHPIVYLGFFSSQLIVSYIAWLSLLLYFDQQKNNYTRPWRTGFNWLRQTSGDEQSHTSQQRRISYFSFVFIIKISSLPKYIPGHRFWSESGYFMSKPSIGLLLRLKLCILSILNRELEISKCIGKYISGKIIIYLF